MVKKAAALVLAIVIFRGSVICAVGADVPSVSAHSAALMVAQTGELIYGKNEHEKRGMASTTKIMTALLTLRFASPDLVITVTEEMANVEGSSMGLLPGDKVTCHDLVYGMLLASGNDAANTAAIALGGSVVEFVELMNKTAADMGMKNTNFVTPSGLDAKNHYSSAYDMALLGCKAIENPDFRQACSSVQAKLCYGNEPYTRYLTNHNRLLKSFDGAFGIKTGFTKKSGRCLVSAATRNGVTLVCVTLNAPNDWQDHAALLEYGFAVTSVKQLGGFSAHIAVFGGTADSVDAVATQEVQFGVYSPQAVVEAVTLAKPYVVAPVRKGDVLGEAQIKLNGNIIKTVPLVAERSVVKTTEEVKPRSKPIKRFFTRIRQILNKIFDCFKER